MSIKVEKQRVMTSGLAQEVALPSDILAMATSAGPPLGPTVKVGLSLAARWDSNLTGCYISPALRDLSGIDSRSELLAPPMAKLAAPLHAAAAFRSFAEEGGARHADWMSTRTGLAPTLQHLGAWHDLAIIERDIVEEAQMLRILGETILVCRTPCIILPAGWDREFAFERILIGWNGSIEATRAIHAALPFLRVASEVTLVDGHVPHAEHDHAQSAPHFDPSAYLQGHGIAVKTRRIQATPGAAGEALLKQVRQAHADLLVLGAYGHSRIPERVLGGATRHILENLGVPVFMRH
jgi:nucleotide-binding universal stress UspA family protein